MTKIELQKFIEEKSNRQIILKERMNLLNALDTELSGSKIGRWFGSAYLVTKRFITLLLGIILIVGSIFFFFFPEIFFRDESVKNEIVQEYKTNFSQETGAPLDLRIEEVSKNYSKTNAVSLINNIDQSIKLSIENDNKNKFQFMAILGIILGIVLLYIARLTKQIRLRNTKISDAENLTQAIIKDYSLTIDEEDDELKILRAYLNTMN
jgi:hypothetical protein